MRDPDALVPNWQPPTAPPPDLSLVGRYVRLDPLSPDHAPDLFQSFMGHDPVWDYMPYGPFDDVAACTDWLNDAISVSDPFFLAITDLESGRVTGQASYLRIAPLAGSIEVGHIAMSPALQRTRAATEAMARMMGWAFDAGYRRYEWKCNASNIPSRRAAQRLGLSFEGIFRKAAVLKGRNRDTAWFAAIDEEWPALKSAFDAWLDPENFDAEGLQRAALSELTARIRVAGDPAL